MAQHSQPVAQEQEQHMAQPVHHQILQQELTQPQPGLLPTPCTTPQPNYNHANNNPTLTPTRSFTPNGIYGGSSSQPLPQQLSLAAAPSIYNPAPSMYIPSSGVQTNPAMYTMPAQMPYNVTGSVNMHNWAHTVPTYPSTHFLQSELPTDQNQQMMHTMPAMQMSMGSQGPVVHNAHPGGGSARFHQYPRRGRGRGGNQYRRGDYHHHTSFRHTPSAESPVQQNIESMQHIPSQQPSLEQHIVSAPQTYAQHPQFVHAQPFQAFPYPYMTHQSHIQVHPSPGVATQATAGPMYMSQMPVYNAPIYNYGYVYPILNAGEYQYMSPGGEETHVDNRGAQHEGVMQPVWHSQPVYQNDYASSEMMSPNYPMYDQQQVHEMQQQPLVPMYENQQIDYMQGMHPAASISQTENGASILQPVVPMPMPMNENLGMSCEIPQTHTMTVSAPPAQVICEKNAQTDDMERHDYVFVQEDTTNNTNQHEVGVGEPAEKPKVVLVTRSDATFETGGMRTSQTSISSNNADRQWPKANTPQQKPAEKLVKVDDFVVGASVQTPQLTLSFEAPPRYPPHVEDSACEQFQNLSLSEPQVVQMIQPIESVKKEQSVETLEPVEPTNPIYVTTTIESGEAANPANVAKFIESIKLTELKKSMEAISSTEAVKSIGSAEGTKPAESSQSRSGPPQLISAAAASINQAQQLKQPKHGKQTQKASNKQRADGPQANTQGQSQEQRKTNSQQSVVHPGNTTSKKKQQQHHQQQPHHTPQQQQQHADKNSNANKNQYSQSQAQTLPTNNNNNIATNNNNNNITLQTDSSNAKISHKKATATVSVTATPINNNNNNNNNIVHQKQTLPGQNPHDFEGHQVESINQQHFQLQQPQLGPAQVQAQEQHQAQSQPQLYQRDDRETSKQPKILEQKIELRSEQQKHQKGKTERKNSSGRALPTSPTATVVPKYDRREVPKNVSTQKLSAGQSLSPSLTDESHPSQSQKSREVSLATVESAAPPNLVPPIDTTANIAAATTTTAATSAPAVAAAPAPTPAIPSGTPASAPALSWASLFTGNKQSTVQQTASLVAPTINPQPVNVSPYDQPMTTAAATTSASVIPDGGAGTSDGPATHIAAGALSYSAASAQGLPTVAANPQAKVKQQVPRQPEPAISSRHNSLSHDEWGIRYAEHLLKYNTDLAPVSLRPRGLTNRSNYCYINSILQALLGCAPFVNMIRAIPHQAATLSGTKTPTLSAMISLIAAFSDLPSGQHLRNPRKSGPRNKDELGVELTTENSVEPSDLYKLWNNSRAEHAEGRQEDAEEFLGYALNKMNDEMLEVIKLVAKPTPPQNGQNIETEDGDAWQMICNNKNKGSITRQTDFGKTPLSDIFRGELRSRLQREGEHSTDIIQPFFTLQLNIEKAASVKEAIEILVGRDQLEGVTGSKTKQEVAAWHQVTLEKLPIILILHLKWFDYKTEGCTKILKKVEFPIELKLDSKTLASKKYMVKRTYRLFAVVYHDGKEASKGHYITDVYHTGYSSWLRFDDSAVKAVSEKNVLTPRSPRVPYLLYYRRCDTIQSPPANTPMPSSYSQRDHEHK